MHDRDRRYVVYQVSEIEALGLVQRIPGKEDTRQKRLFLTEKGKDLMDAVIQIIADIMKFVGKEIDHEKMRDCKEVLRQVLKNLTES